MSASNQYQELPDSEVASLARESATELSKLLAEHPEIDRAQVKMDGHDLILPKQALSLLRDLLIEMAQGNAVTVVPTHAELTTQQAADFLNISRPYLIRLLEKKKIPFTKVGTHRRIKYEELLKYKRKIKQDAEEALVNLIAEAQELGMGY